MAKTKTLDQLRAEKEQAEAQLLQEQHKLQRLEQRKKHYEKGERKKRTHRLCNLGGMVESVAPEVKDLTRTEMTELMEHIFSLSEVQRAVRHMAIAKPQAPDLVSLLNAYYTQRRAGAYSQKGKVSNLKEMNETFNYLRANGIYSLEDLESRVSEHSAATESLKKTLDEQTARMKAIKQLYDSSAAFQSLKPVYDGLQKIKFEKPRAKYKAEHEAELKQFYAARRKLTGEFPDGKVDMKKLTEEYDELEQAHNTTYGEFKTVRDDLHRLWKVKSCVDTGRDPVGRSHTPNGRMG